MAQATPPPPPPPVFRHPFTMCVSGCTGSGKSQWVLRMLSNLAAMVDTPIYGVLYCFGEVNEEVLRLQQMDTTIRVCHGVPEEAHVQREARNMQGRLLLVLDDLMVGMRAPFLDVLFTRGSHNWGVSVVLLTQHLFTRELRIARNNSHYLVLLRNPAGALQVRTLGTQLFPGGALAHFIEAYEDATAEPFGYLLIDMHPTTRPPMRLRTHIYPGELTVVYLPRAQANKAVRGRRGRTRISVAVPTLGGPSPYVRQNIDFIQRLTKCRSARGRAYRTLVRSASTEQLLCLVECALNVLRSRQDQERARGTHPSAASTDWSRGASFGRTACQHRAPTPCRQSGVRAVDNKDNDNNDATPKNMKHTTRMLLIPEDMYAKLMMMMSGSVSDSAGPTTISGTAPATVTPIAHTATRMARLAGSNDAAKLMNSDERLIHYQQEFKRYQKLLADEQERPTNVRLTQLPSDAASKAVLRDAMAEAGAIMHQQTETPPRVRLRTKRRHMHAPTATGAEAPSTESDASTGASRSSVAANEHVVGAKRRGSRTVHPSTSSFASAFTGDEMEVEAREEEGDDKGHYPMEKQQENAEAKPTTNGATGTAAAAAAPKFNSEEAARRQQEVLEYVQQNAAALGVGGHEGLQVYRLMHGEYRPIKDSNIRTVLAYHFVGRHHSATPTGTPKSKPPPGYQTFITNAKKDPQASLALFSTTTEQQRPHMSSSSGSNLTGTTRKRQLRGAAAPPPHNLATSTGMGRTGALQRSNRAFGPDGSKSWEGRERLVERLLDQLYKDTRSPAAFTSVEPLLREAARAHPQHAITRAETRRYLSRQRVYTLHRRAVRRFRRLPTLASGLHTDWQADLADFVQLKRYNRGHAYLLVCVDTLSRQLFVEPVLSKQAAHIVTAFEHIFRRAGYTPWKLMTDQGKEFTANAVQHYLAKKEVQHHCMHTSPQWHAGIAERANRSIKERLYRYFTHRGTKCWTVPSLACDRPTVNFGNAEQLRRRLVDKAKSATLGSTHGGRRFRVGDRVRIEKHKHVFQKGYLPRFTDEQFTVAEVRTTRSPVTYKLRDDDGEVLTGWFYAQDLCLVLPLGGKEAPEKEGMQDKDGSARPAVYDIERVLKRRKNRAGVEQCLVKWAGYSDKQNICYNAALVNPTRQMTSSFYIVLPSNTNVEGNRTNSFRVRLPRKLQFNSQWSVGLAVLVYPHSWPSLGTTEEQFVRVQWQTGEEVLIRVPAGSVRNPHELLDTLHTALGDGSEQLASQLRTLQREYHRLSAEAEVAAKNEFAQRVIEQQQQQQQPEKKQQLTTTTQPAGGKEKRKRKKEPESRDQQRDVAGDAAATNQTADVPITQKKDDEASAAVTFATGVEPAVESSSDDTHQQQQQQQKQQEAEQFNSIHAGLLNQAVKEQMSERDQEMLQKHLPVGLELWIHSYRKARLSCRFSFDADRQRFQLELDQRRIKNVELSEQLAYILGFSTRHMAEALHVARYQPDMKGGVSNFYVYAPGLIEPVIVGDVVAPVLRMVNIRGPADDMIEECYNAVQYHNLITKEIAEIFIEIRTSSGALMPFQYGTSDRIPTLARPMPHCMVANMDSSSAGGSHWVAIYVQSVHAVDYFDSFGDWPPYSPYIHNFLRRFHTVNRNVRALQSDRSASCGKHVIYFLCHRCRNGWTLRRVVAHIVEQKTEPDRLVSAFVRTHIFDAHAV
uniref:Integrase catalytic domain-containing protein n=1 Tax=Globodera rostochiensis TaxID=31243 RepID=A0A914H7W1_GLORO